MTVPTNGTLAFSHDLTLDADLTGYTAWNSGGTKVRFRSILLEKYIPPTATSPITTVEQGLVALKPDGSVVRLGFYNDSAYAPTIGSTSISIDGSTGSNQTYTSGALVDVSEYDDAFSDFNGDFNRDGVLQWSDLTALNAALNVSIGDQLYNPRGDFDLDGTIDSSDYAALILLLRCNTDIDSDGDFGTDADIAEFFNSLSSGAVYADFDGDGDAGTDNDIDSFYSALAAGPCPL